MFDFQTMLEQYQQDIVIITETDGSWGSDGQWSEGTLTETETQAPVLPVSPDDMKFDDLTYSANDRKIYYHGHLAIGQKVKIDDIEVSVMQRRDYSYHANGLRIYIVSRSDAGD